MAELCPLSEELSCCICQELFKDPVTIPCGHSFCMSCLDRTWVFQGEPYWCPQCRTSYTARPLLHKSTVLCAVVEQLVQTSQVQAEQEQAQATACDRKPAGCSEDKDWLPCNQCPREQAVMTCLECRASFCLVHLQPHLSDPAFRDHPLQTHIPDLQLHKCPQHYRLQEFFCPEHSKCICQSCLVEHKVCSPITLSQASTDLENKLRQKLSIMDSEISRACLALEDMQARKQRVQDAAGQKIEEMKQEYREMKVLIDSSEASTIHKIKEEEKRMRSEFDSAYQILLKKRNEIQTLKDEVELNLAEKDKFEFVEKASKLQEISMKPVYVPRVGDELMKDICQGTVDLKNKLSRAVQQLQDKKFPHPFTSVTLGASRTARAVAVNVINEAICDSDMFLTISDC
ncbi:E3 ubiquitin/ISG15 ligase TRIM25-like isoform X1 [Cavia porcellus]|uniref:E3 ubiquitin/ISG15 ligase TRIM25-like isoform X1 n=1 Tax=Cavia porcellus TaxID=10141 RepID=UPI002FDF9309